MTMTVSSGSVTTGPAARAARTTVRSTAALKTRTTSGLIPVLPAVATRAPVGRDCSGDATPGPRRGAGVRRRQPAELALAGVEGGDRLDQVLLAEIRPQRLGEVKLRVRGLPDKEVGDALLAGGADDQFRIEKVR